MPESVFRMALPGGAYRYFVDGAETDRQTWAKARVEIELGDVDRRYQQLGEAFERLGEDLAQLRAKLLDVFAESE
jgi:hypothetical protein